MKKTLLFALAIAVIPDGLDGGYDHAYSLGYQILQTYDHDPEAYTQGLLFHDGYLFESTGLFDTSTLRKVEVETGRVIAAVAIDPLYYAEGLALVGSELVLLTWKAGIA